MSAPVSAQVSVTATEVEITAQLGDPTNSTGKALLFRCTVDCYVGPTGVLTSTGFLLVAGEILALDLSGVEDDRYYAIRAGGTSGTGYVLRRPR